MTENNNESMVRYLLIEIAEAAIGMALDNDTELCERVRSLSGHIIRIKTDTPDLSFYIEFSEGAVHLYAEHEGPVSARVRLPSHLMASQLLGLPVSLDDEDLELIRLSGDEAVVAELKSIAQEFSLWRLLKNIIAGWLPDYETLEELLVAMRSNDPDWMTRFEHLPQLVNETMMLLREQQRLQQQQMQEIRAIREQLNADRRASQISTVVGFCLIVVAFMAHNGYLKVPQLETLSLDTVIMLIVAMVLLVPRMIRQR